MRLFYGDTTHDEHDGYDLAADAARHFRFHIRRPARTRCDWPRSTSASARRCATNDSAFWVEWDAYRQRSRCAAAADGAVEPAHARWLLTSARFSNDCSTSARRRSTVRAATRAQDDLFRFKVDFVRRRALPLLKGGHVERSTAEDNAVAASSDATWTAADAGAGAADLELALARAGCPLLDREKTDKAAVADDDRGAEALVRGPPARSGLSRPGSCSGSREHRPWNLVQVQRPDPRCRSRCSDRTAAFGGATASS